GRRGVKIMKLLDLYMPPLSGNGSNRSSCYSTF
ncbi:Uncharacterized protein TCM_043071 isoform 2, partial [Theobroma cacao]